MRRKRSVYFFAIALLPLVFVLQSPRVSVPLRQTSQMMLRPVFSMGSASVSFVSGIRQYFFRLYQTFQSQDIDRKKIEELETQLLRFSEIEKENGRLRDLLEFKKDFQKKSVGAQIIGWDPSPWRKTILINKGWQQGVDKDMSVVVRDGLVGRVIESFANSARVLLIADSDARVSGIAGQSRAQGVVSGNGSPVLEMRYLELESEVSVGETVMSSGVGNLFPKGIAIGTITAIKRDETGLHLKADVQPFVKFSKIEEVLCIAL